MGLDASVCYKVSRPGLARTALVGQPSAERDDLYAWMMKPGHHRDMQLTAGRFPAAEERKTEGANPMGGSRIPVQA